MDLLKLTSIRQLIDANRANRWRLARKWWLMMLGSVRTRLILLVLLAMLPVFGLSLYTSSRMTELGMEHARDNLLRLARLTAANQEQNLEGARQLLIALSHSPQIKDSSSEICSQFLTRLQSSTPITRC
jgi:hypothetical protein